MPTVNMEFGRGARPLEVPAPQWVGLLQPRPVQGLADVEAAARASLDAPLGSAPLRELLPRARSVLILTVDNSRPSPAPLLTPILDQCGAAGVAVTVCIAIGRHRPMRDDEIRDHLTPGVCGRCTVIQHDPFDDALHRDLGVTTRGTPVRLNRAVFEHDVVMGVGIIEPSYLAGFSGGRKLLLPGVAHRSSIDANHYLLLDPNTRIGRLAGNPLSEDAAEASRMAPYHWITYAVVGPHDETVAVVSGDPYVAHEAACRRSAEIYRVPRCQADVVVSCPGGHPYDVDMVQTKKAVVPAAECVNPGGAIILAGETGEGWGAEPTFAEWMRTLTPEQIVERVRDRDQFSLGAHGANILAKPAALAGVEVILVANERFCREVAGTFVRGEPDLQEALDSACAARGRHATVLAIRNARRVIVGEV